jgi:signal transduction histidine kinase
VRGLLDFSRPRTLSDENADVRDVVLTTIELMEQQGVFKQLHITSEFDERLLMARCDRHQLQQVVINLLLNSRDATPAEGFIKVRGTQEGEQIRLDVIDSGSGIAESALGHVFDPFFTTKPPGKGTGLGLAISSRIIEGFGGRITVASVVDEGSCFSLWLPLVQG